MERYDRVISLIWVAIGVLLCLEAWSLGLGKVSEPQTGFMPFVVGLGIIVLSVFLFFDSSLTLRKNRSLKVSIWSGVNWRRILYMVVLLAGYAVLLRRLGYLVDTFLLMTLLIKSAEDSRWPGAVLSGLLITAVSHLIFRVWLLVPFPEGILSF
jgi:putative tricarboxylic transport membrane protein